MAKQTVKFSAKVDFKMDVEKAKKDLKSFEKSLQDVANMSDVSKKRKQEASDLAQRMTKMASTDTSKMNPEQLKKHQQDLNKLKQEYFKLTNAISNARVAEIQGHEDIKDKLEVQNSKYKKIAGSIGQYLKSLERIRSTTALITQEAEKGKQLMGDIGVDFTNPSSIKSKMESIPRGARGGFKNTADKELYKQLEEHLKKINELTDNGKNTVETLEEEYSRVTTELNKQMELAAQIRENKAAIVQEVVQAALQEGKITQEEADQIIAQQKELDLEQEITEEKQKQKALDAGTDIKKNIKESKKLADTNQQVKKSFLGKVTAATLYYAALRALKKLMSSVVNTVRELDKSITEVAMVTSLNRKDAWKLVDAYQNLAYQVGATTDEVARLSVYFFRQGRTAEDALELTKVAAIAAKVAAIDMAESANYLTSAINGFGLAADQAMVVSDKFASLAASSASSYEEMAIALSKVAPVAKTAGVGIDFMMGVIAKGIETTREAPENIGTAFKTIFARMTQIREFGATLDDATGVNKVEEALRQAGVALRDSSGVFRDMDDVLTELGYAFSGLDRNQQSYIATALAGTRQQSRLLAVMQNFDRTMELVANSTNSAGATLAQHAEYAGGMQAANARLVTSWEQLILTFSETQIIIDIVDAMARGLKALAEEIKRNGPLMIGILAAIGVAITAVSIKMGLLAAKVTVATGGLNLIIPLIIAAGTLLYGLFRKGETEAEKFEKRVAKINEKVKDLQVNLFNNQKSLSTVRSLAKRYEELNSKIVKTADELLEIEEILEKIDEYSDEEHDLVINGKLGEDLKRFLDYYEAQVAIDRGELVSAGKELVMESNQGKIDFDPSQREAAAAYMAQTLTKFTDVYSMAEDDQAAIFDLIYSNFDEYLDRFRSFIDSSDNLSGEMESIMDFKDMTKIDNSYIGLMTTGEDLNRAFGGTVEMWQENLDKSKDRVIKDIMDNANRAGMNYTYEQAEEWLYDNGSIYREQLNDAFEMFIDQSYGSLSAEFRFGGNRSPEIKSSLTNLYKNINEMIKNTSMDDPAVWQEFLGLSKEDQSIIVSAIPELASLVAFETNDAIDILRSNIEGIDGVQLGFSEKLSIIEALQNAGLNQEDISNFFDKTKDFTAGSIKSFLEFIEDTVDDPRLFGNLATDLFDVLTGGEVSSSFMNDIEKQINKTKTLMDLQKKILDGEFLTAEEFGIAQEMLAGSGLLDTFLSGQLTPDMISSDFQKSMKTQIAEAIAAVEDELSFMETDDPSRIILEDELSSLYAILNNIDSVFESDQMKNFYESQIDYIQQITKDLQDQIDLEQQRIDMNRSMLSLNRQITALERDTSFGAQARLEDLRLTRAAEAAQRESFVMDMVANQMIEGLQSQIQESIKVNTEATAINTAKLVELAGGKPVDYTTIEKNLGITVRGGSGNITGGGRDLAIASFD